MGGSERCGFSWPTSSGTGAPVWNGSCSTRSDGWKTPVTRSRTSRRSIPENDASPWSDYFAPYLEIGPQTTLTPREKAIAVERMFWNTVAARRFARLLRDFRPDVVHVHGIHRQISPSILLEARRAGVPVVQTLHDYHPICASGDLLARRPARLRPAALRTGQCPPVPPPRVRAPEQGEERSRSRRAPLAPMGGPLRAARGRVHIAEPVSGPDRRRERHPSPADPRAAECDPRARTHARRTRRRGVRVRRPPVPREGPGHAPAGS